MSAPAGFGKTTLLTDWLSEPSDRDRRVAWLSLDATDIEPAAFWTYVAAALESAVPSIGETAAELLGFSPVPMDRVLSTLLNELAETLDEIWLILDDYHHVDDRDVGQAVAFFLEHLPAHVHVVLSTRADPDLPLARWRVRGELVEIRAADLRFTPEEAAAYLAAATGLDLAGEDVAVLEEGTEGWIAALQLAALSLQGRPDVSSFITRFAGDDRYIVDYLIEEVLAHQPKAVRAFLLQSAVLDRLTGPLCDTVTDREDGSEMILALERANLFVVALDDQRTWYRYHHLFSDVLRARLLNERPDQVPLLHQRASQWYERHDLVQEAVRHALAARDFDRAAHLVELAAAEIRRHRQEAVMYGWLQALPDDAVRRRPVLSVFYGSMLMASGDLAAVEPRLADAERALASVPAGAALPWADRRAPDPAVHHRDVPRRARPSPRGCGGHGGTRPARLGAGRPERPSGARGLGELDVEAGDLESARRDLEAAAASTDRSGLNEGRFRWFAARGLLAKADGEPEEAVVLLDQAAALYRSGFYPDVRPIPALKARIWITRGNLSEAGAGPGTEAGPSPTKSATCTSSTTSHSCVCSSRSTQHTTTPTSSTRPPICWGGCTPPPRRCNAPEVSSRSGCCKRWSNTGRDGERRLRPRSPKP
jgi:LuxR family maltose regulon positive regulatory protein